MPVARIVMSHAPAAVRLAAWPWVERNLAWRDYRFQVQTAAGELTGTTLDVIQKYLYFFSIWEPAATSWVRQSLSPGDTFLDVGANIGYFTLLAGRMGARVIAIEASSGIFATLQKHVRLNGLEKTTRLIHVAVSDAVGELVLHWGGEYNIGSTSLVRNREGGFSEVVRTAPLDQLLTAEEIRSVRIVKIDVEGAEWQALRGFQSLAQLPADAELLVEITPEYNGRDVLHQIEKAGYFPYLMPHEEVRQYVTAPTLRLPRFRGELSRRVDLLFSKRDEDSLVPRRRL